MSAFLYILRCNGGKYYVGSTVDLERRMKEHAARRGCAFTKAHLLFELVYTEEHPSYESAYERECQVHKWSRAKKERLIKGELPYKGRFNLGSRGTRMTTTVETRICELQSDSRAGSRDNSDNTRRWFRMLSP